MYIFTFVNTLYKNEKRIIILNFYSTLFVIRLIDSMLIDGWAIAKWTINGDRKEKENEVCNPE